MLNRKIQIMALTAGLAFLPAIAISQTVPVVAPESAPQQPIDPAVKAQLDASLAQANEFVTSLDRRQYAQALDMTGPQFRQSLGTLKFDQVITEFQAKNGAVKTRELFAAQPIRPPEPANVPQGNYAVIHFRTDYAVTGPHDELVFLHETAKDSWNVTGYFANPVPPEQDAAPAD